MKRYQSAWRRAALAAIPASVLFIQGQQAGPGARTGSISAAAKTIAEADCTAAKLGSEIPAGDIGAPVSAVTLNAPQWHAEANGVPAYCSVEGSMAPVDKSPTARPIRFGVALSGILGFPRGPTRRWRHERFDSAIDRRRRPRRFFSAARLRYLRQRLRPPERRVRAASGGRLGAARQCRECFPDDAVLTPQRRGACRGCLRLSARRTRRRISGR